jgi:CHAT domain-containing protein/tetratricopeptide (TPR) repeat protein
MEHFFKPERHKFSVLKPLSFLLAFIIFLPACAEKKMTLEEARQVTVSMSGEAFVPPPRRIDDILAILDQPGEFDSEITKKHRAIADASPPKTNNARTLYLFYVKRGQAVMQISRLTQALGDFRNALYFSQLAKINDPWVFNRLGLMELYCGNFKRGIQLLERSLKIEKNGSTYMFLVEAYTLLGDLQTAETIKNIGVNFCHRSVEGIMKSILTDIMRATVLEANGNFEEAEKHWRRRLKNAANIKTQFPKHLIVGRTQLANNLIKQNRLLEAERELRIATKAAIALFGKDSEGTGSRIQYLGIALQKQGRLQDARKLLKAGLRLLHNSGLSRDSYIGGYGRMLYGNILVDQGNYSEAVAIYESAKEALAKNQYLFEKIFARNPNLMLCLMKTGRIKEAQQLITGAYHVYRNNFGKDYYMTAEMLGLRGMAAFTENKLEQAAKDFSKSIPVLLAANITTTGDYSTRQRFNHITDTYIDLLSKIHGSHLEKELKLNASAEAFRLVDVVRGQVVQNAIKASGARVAIGNAELADLVRKEQDTYQQIDALQSIVCDTLTAPKDQQDPAAIESLTAKLDILIKAHKSLLMEIKKLFPKYSNFTNPQPATISMVKKHLQPTEAFISIYSTDDHCYVWCIPSDGETKFSKSNMGKKEINQIVNQLRKALSPEPETLGDIPEFDLRLANKLFHHLLKPVETGWKEAKHLIVVTHGSLGQLPFAVLPTSAVIPQANEVLFGCYRNVPWLIRKVSITRQPSVSSFVTLRSLPEGDSKRKSFAGFGDPFFNKTQLAESQKIKSIKKPAVTAPQKHLQIRGIRITDTGNLDSEAITSSHLGMLNRLPDTSDEILSIASALDPNLEKDVFIGKRASEQKIKTIDLSDRRVVAFATHALIPGDLDGLDQPALAFCSPEVTGENEDGLLTLGEIFTLKLNADWVMLSACNTGAADGTGAEAVSGLGRAFFYAGTRAILASMWSVETTSAKKLTTGIFQYQKEDKSISRALAHQKSMIALIDSPGFIDSKTGKIVASYAHPFFWASFIIVGEGRGNLN